MHLGHSRLDQGTHRVDVFPFPGAQVLGRRDNRFDEASYVVGWPLAQLLQLLRLIQLHGIIELVGDREHFRDVVFGRSLWKHP